MFILRKCLVLRYVDRVETARLDSFPDGCRGGPKEVITSSRCQFVFSHLFVPTVNLYLSPEELNPALDPSSLFSMEFGSRRMNMTQRRIQLRQRLDDLPDFLVDGTNVELRQTFETVEAAETYCRAPQEIIEAA